MAINILLADDQKAFRDFLRRLLESNPAINIAAEAASGEQAVRLTEMLRPDLVLMNMDMPQEVDGLEATRRLKGRLQHTKVVLMSLLGDDAHKQAALASGADGFVSKGAPIPEWFSMIWDLASRLRGRAASPGKSELSS